MKKNIIFTLVLLFVAIAAFASILLTNSNTKNAVVSVANGQTYTLPLNSNKTYNYTTQTGSILDFTIEVKDGRARFIDSNCPDGLCENFGWVENSYDQAICLPAGVMLTVQE